MNPVLSVFKMHSRNALLWFLMPWIVLLISLSTNLLIGLLLEGKTAIYTGGLSSIYIFMFIMGLLTPRDTFPFALGFGARRSDYVLGTLLMLLVISLVSAFCLCLLSLIESSVTAYWGVNVHFFHLPYLSAGSLPEQFWVYFAPLVHLYLLGFAIGSIYRRFGSIGMWIFCCLAFLLLGSVSLLWTYLRQWSKLLALLSQFTAFELASWAFLLAVIYALAAYVLLRKATV
jgi:hypothetical protein